MPLLTRPPITTDRDACLVAGTWAGFRPDATVEVTVAWLAAVMERVNPTPAQIVQQACAALTDVAYHDECRSCEAEPITDDGYRTDHQYLAAEANEDEVRDAEGEQ